MSYGVVLLHPDGTHTTEFWDTLAPVAEKYDLGKYGIERLEGKAPGCTRMDIWRTDAPHVHIFNTVYHSFGFNKRQKRWMMIGKRKGQEGRTKIGK